MPALAGQTEAGAIKRAHRRPHFSTTRLGGDSPDGLAGVFGGAQAGVNFQSGPWVYGLEAAIDGSGVESNFTSTAPSSARDDQFKARLDVLVLLTGRAGYTWNNMLAYAKGGYALTRIHLSVSDTNPPMTGSGSDAQWHSGPTVGAGVEQALTPQLSLAAEYNHIWLGSGTYQLGGGAGNYTWNVNIRDINLFMVKLNYRFAAR